MASGSALNASLAKGIFSGKSFRSVMAFSSLRRQSFYDKATQSSDIVETFLQVEIFKLWFLPVSSSKGFHLPRNIYFLPT